jgi:hypothetical protein
MYSSLYFVIPVSLLVERVRKRAQPKWGGRAPPPAIRKHFVCQARPDATFGAPHTAVTGGIPSMKAFISATELSNAMNAA